MIGCKSTNKLVRIYASGLGWLLFCFDTYITFTSVCIFLSPAFKVFKNTKHTWNNKVFKLYFQVFKSYLFTILNNKAFPFLTCSGSCCCQSSTCFTPASVCHLVGKCSWKMCVFWYLSGHFCSATKGAHLTALNDGNATFLAHTAKWCPGRNASRLSRWHQLTTLSLQNPSLSHHFSPGRMEE